MLKRTLIVLSLTFVLVASALPLPNVAGMLIQADRFGTSIARAVRVYSDSLRTKRRQRAEQAAQKAAFKLLLPLGALLFPTMFIIILGPALLNISDMLGGGLGF